MNKNYKRLKPFHSVVSKLKPIGMLIATAGSVYFALVAFAYGFILYDIGYQVASYNTELASSVPISAQRHQIISDGIALRQEIYNLPVWGIFFRLPTPIKLAIWVVMVCLSIVLIFYWLEKLLALFMGKEKARAFLADLGFGKR